MSQDKVFNSEFIDFFVEFSLEDLREMSNMDTAVAIANDVENGADHIPSFSTDYLSEKVSLEEMEESFQLLRKVLVDQARNGGSASDESIGILFDQVRQTPPEIPKLKPEEDREELTLEHVDGCPYKGIEARKCTCNVTHNYKMLVPFYETTEADPLGTKLEFDEDAKFIRENEDGSEEEYEPNEDDLDVWVSLYNDNIWYWIRWHLFMTVLNTVLEPKLGKPIKICNCVGCDNIAYGKGIKYCSSRCGLRQRQRDRRKRIASA